MTATNSRSVGYGEGREVLVRAAIHVVAQRGLRNLTYRAVAAEAGVTHGLVAHHFGSREALITEALHYAVARSVETTLLTPDTSDLSSFASDLPDLVENDPDLQAFQFELFLEARRNPELQPIAVELYDTYRRATQAALERFGISDALTADLVFAALDGLVYQQVTLRGSDATRDALGRLRELLEVLRSAQTAGTRPSD